MEKNYSPREAAAVLGVAVHTIQVWDREGKIRCLRLPSGRRRIPESEVRRLLNLKEQRKDAIYARVLSGSQKQDLERQIEELRTVAPNAAVYADTRSGLNFRRTSLFQLLDEVADKKIARIYVVSEDRLARIGFELIAWVCEKYGTGIVVADDRESSVSQEERGKDLVAIILAFSAKLFGLRSQNTKSILRAVKKGLAEIRPA